MPELISEKTLIHKPLHIQEAEIRDQDGTYERTRVQREEGAALLMHNLSNNSIVMTRQYRYAVHDKTESWLLEIPAGKIENHDKPASTMARECMEETGYDISEKDLVPLGSFFMSPGYTSEKLHLFAVSVHNHQKTSKGGGLEEEHEHIEVVEIPLAEFRAKVIDHSWEDAKTQLAGLIWLNMNKT